MRHRLLKRQIKKHLDEELLDSGKLDGFLDAIDTAYQNFNADYEQLERTLEISATESFKELSDFRNAISTTSMVVITDYRGKIVFVNDNLCTASGYKKEELIGDNYQNYNSRFHTKEFYKEMYKTILDGNIWKGEVKEVSKSGKPYWVDTTIVPLLNTAGKPNKFITFKIDISKIKNAEQESKDHAADLERINKELDQFAYVVSHDLKAPLRAINNLSEWIQEDLEELMDEDNKKNMDLLRGRVKRMELLINGILDYSRIGRMEHKQLVVDLNELFQEIKDANVIDDSIEIYFQEDLPQIFTERIPLYQVLQNLVSNAIKYNDKDEKRLKITFERSVDGFKFSVCDNGPGIEKDFHDKIFVIFQTLQSRDKVESTGVGLAIVKKIIEEKGGKISVKSEMGVGSEFTFTWPSTKVNL